MKSKSKGNDKDENEQWEFFHGLENVSKHDEEDSKERKLCEIFEKIEPNTYHQNWAHRPHPALLKKSYSHTDQNVLLRYLHVRAPGSKTKELKKVELKNKYQSQNVYSPINRIGPLEVAPVHLQANKTFVSNVDFNKKYLHDTFPQSQPTWEE